MNTRTPLSDVQKTCVSKGLPFVSFRLPDSREVTTYIQTEDVLHRIHDFRTDWGFVFAPFQQSGVRPQVLLMPDHILEGNHFRQEDLPFQQERSGIEFTNKMPVATPKEAYLKHISQALEAITRKQLDKMVLSRVQHYELPTSFSPFILFRQLCESYPQAFVYFFHHPRVGTWMGASPETFLSMEEGSLQTVSLAGTARYLSAEEQEQFQWGSKEREEQAIVSTWIKAILEKHHIQNLGIEGPVNKQAGQLIHLFTRFQGQVPQGFDLNAFISDLHPTPAVCGVPKKEALEYIHQIETHDRAYYTGFLGPLNMESKTHLFVNLRCMQLFQKNVALYLGGGITKDSEPEKEWQETIDKAQTLLAVIEAQNKEDVFR